MRDLVLVFSDIFSAIFLEQIYRQFCAGLDHKTSMKTVNKLFSKNVYSYLHYSVEGGKNDASFDIHCKSVIYSIEFASTKKNLPFTVFKPTAIGRITEYEKSDVNQSIYNRFDRICKKAFEKNIKILIDAEESWVQDSIDNLVDKMMSNNVCRDLIYPDYKKEIRPSYEEPAIAEINGQMWKGKADILNHEEQLIIDLKTTSDLDKFRWNAKKYNYDSQAYIYRAVSYTHLTLPTKRIV